VSCLGGRLDVSAHPNGHDTVDGPAFRAGRRTLGPAADDLSRARVFGATNVVDAGEEGIGLVDERLLLRFVRFHQRLLPKQDVLVGQCFHVIGLDRERTIRRADSLEHVFPLQVLRQGAFPLQLLLVKRRQRDIPRRVVGRQGRRLFDDRHGLVELACLGVERREGPQCRGFARKPAARVEEDGFCFGQGLACAEGLGELRIQFAIIWILREGRTEPRDLARLGRRGRAAREARISRRGLLRGKHERPSDQAGQHNGFQQTHGHLPSG
jgi:hypothetical protein